MRLFADLKNAHLPHCNWRDFLHYKGTEPLPRQDEEALDHYFSHFLPPGPCVKCGHKQGSDNEFEAFLGVGRFRWGIQNGEGQCSTGGCGWPARAIHRDVGPIKELQLILQYHPDVMTWDE